MITFYLITQLSVFLGVLYWYWRLAKRFTDGTRQNCYRWMKEKKMWYGIVMAVVFMLVTLPFIGPMKKTVWCAYKGYEHSVDTRRDLISGRCSYKGAGGEWVPIERLVGVAESTDKSTENTEMNNAILANP